MSTPEEQARALEKTMRCNCDLDNWQPEASTGHSWVCRIHQAVTGTRSLPSVQSPDDAAYDAWATGPSRMADGWGDSDE